MAVECFRVLLTNVTLASRTGTETATRGLALGLAAAGHRPTVFSSSLGDIAAEIRAAGIPVVSSLDDVTDAPNLVHGHHHAETVAALMHFPSVPGLFVCHDRLSPASAPPQFARIRRYVAVDLNCLERLAIDYGMADSI